MSRIFVIAGTAHEANYWIIRDLGKRYPSNTSASMSDYKYVSHVDDVKGYTNPHGVFVGNWLGRPDIFEIVEALMMRSTHVNPALGRIWEQVKPKTRPTPKLTGKQITAIYVDEAAALMAKEIDNEVLKSLMKTTGV
jgi:hypothetical protein